MTSPAIVDAPRWPELVGELIQEQPHREDYCHAIRPRERWGDVVLSVQASWSHYCTPHKGCGHAPLELYESVEIALWWVEGEDWITCPSRELGIDGFDDLWSGDDVAGQVPLMRVGQLQYELRRRAARMESRR